MATETAAFKALDIDSDKLFDTDAFEAWALETEPSDYYPSFGVWQLSHVSGSTYCEIVAQIDDEDGVTHEACLRLRISDHGNPEATTSSIDINICDMPDSRHFTWNTETLWRRIIMAIDEYCAAFCTGCMEPWTACYCDAPPKPQSLAPRQEFTGGKTMEDSQVMT